MSFEWDETKALQNRRKHGLGFHTAAAVFDDPLGLVLYQGSIGGEDRWSLIGVAEPGSSPIILVVHTYRGENVIRIISARKADKHEQRAYREGH